MAGAPHPPIGLCETDKILAIRTGPATLLRMADFAEMIPYERLLSARPVLLWALERQWNAETARSNGLDFHAKENSSWLVLDGVASVTHDGRTHHAGPGHWMFPKPGARVQSFSGPFHFLSLTIRWQWPGGRHLFDEGLTRTLATTEAPWLEPSAIDIIRQVQAITPGSHYHIGRHPVTLMQAARLFALAGTWAAMFLRAMEHLGVPPDTGLTRDPRVETLLAHLQAEWASPMPDRGQLAMAAGVSPRQIDRLIKIATGKTLVENHDQFRYDRICSSLLESGLRVKEIAGAAGFTNLSSFSRWFAKRAGCSPRAYREHFTGV